MIKYIWAWSDTEDVYLNSSDSIIEILLDVLEHEFEDVEINTIQNTFAIKVSGGCFDEDSTEFSIENNTHAVAEFLNQISTFGDRYNRFEIKKLEIKLAIDIQ